MSIAARGKLFTSKYGLVIAAVCLLLAFGAFGLAYQSFADRPTETIVEEVDVQSFEMDTSTEAIVDGNNITLYEPNERLVDMPVYFVGESPVMTLVLTASVPADQAVDLDVRVTLEYEGTRDDMTFYERTEVLGEASQQTTDGSTELRVDVDMRDVFREVDRVRAKVSTVGTLTTRIAAEITYTGAQYEGELSDRTQLVLATNAFWLDEGLSDSVTRSRTVTDTRTLPRDMGSVYLFGGVGTLLLLVGGLAGLVSIRGVDVERLETRLARAEFDEWISHGEIPTRSEKEYVRVESLEDVVDIAIDTNKRVIFDANLEAYGVVDGDIVYYYTPGEDELRDWLDV